MACNYLIKLMIKCVVLPTVLVGSLLSVTQVLASQVIIPAPPQLSALAYLLMDANTGKVLVEHNSRKALPPASLTKMMTAYIVSEEIIQGRLNEQDLVRISDDAWRRGGSASGGSTMFLEPRSDVSVIDLLRGVIIQSGNDASIALAQHIAGSEAAFADVMNQQAALLGMDDTHYENATGLTAEGHLTTVQDLSLLARAIIFDHPEHYPIHAEKYFEYNGINQANRNKLLFTDKHVDGIKTGHTEAAGYCLVSTSERDGVRLIAVVMGTESERVRASESQQLLSYGFRYYTTHVVYETEQALQTARVWGGVAEQLELYADENVVVTIPRGSEASLIAETEVDTDIKAPITEGQVLGELTLKLEDEEVFSTKLVAATSIAQSGFLARTWDEVVLLFQSAWD